MSSRRFACCFRGNDLAHFTPTREFDGIVSGNSHRVWRLESEPDPWPERMDVVVVKVWNVEWGVDVEQVRAPVTGGFTHSIGTAAFFAWNTDGELPLLIYINEGQLDVDLADIRYGDLSWFDDHPGVAAHHSTLGDGEVRAVTARGEEIHGIVHGDGIPHTYPRKDVEFGTSSHAEEREAVALEPEVRYRDAALGIASVFSVNDDFESATLAHQWADIWATWDGRSFLDVKQLKQGLSDEELVREIWEFGDEWTPDWLPAYWVLVLDDVADRQAQFDKAQDSFPPGSFRLAYDGQQMHHDAASIPQWLFGI